MDISINTPALLFPAVSLVLLAYTNRFLALSNRVRSLHDKYLINPTPNKSIHQQIKNLRYRLKLIKNMQTFGVLTFITSIFCIFFLSIMYTHRRLQILLLLSICLKIALCTMGKDRAPQVASLRDIMDHHKRGTPHSKDRWDS